ncbi:MAG TPA: hypothetical protein VG206_11320 [Terriglobia bacterium]|nr:hypothetical protein [Terriglobia bacterium]
MRILTNVRSSNPEADVGRPRVKWRSAVLGFHDRARSYMLVLYNSNQIIVKRVATTRFLRRGLLIGPGGSRNRYTTGTVWRHQFWDRFVRHAGEFRDRLVYMHLNPVRKGLAAKPALVELQQFR